MSDLLRRYASNPIEDIGNLFDLFVFNYLIGNCDAHLKNYSIMRSGDWQEIGLAPAYDLVSTAVYPELTTLMGLHIGTKRRLEEIAFSDLLDLAAEMDISQRVARIRIDELLEKLSAVLSEVEKDSSVARSIAEQTASRINMLRR